ncbi:HDOD domain-containing protein [Alginatibacterium sediminis]|uniref:HDOD domain-containing protein n=1 Tax=Alginatibacterium sediminis TaxID=2164068 RepID=A0A420E785_9ALTE|nr:HDOD domain-containing protein [Alginatibacterium sediminis]RKF14249.1 HDOD domain-containing protein [Alginatibacterium sediminis]
MTIDKFFQQNKKLPVMPEVMQELLGSIDQEGVDLATLGGKIARDQSLGANVLRMANSAAFRGRSEIVSIEAAVIRLGFQRVRSLVVAAGLNGMTAGTHFDHQQFWLQAFTVASLSRALASCCSADPEVAFTCGMMHNIGELMIASAAPEEAGIIQLALSQGQTRVEAQRETLGFDYAQVGAELSRRWQFSPLIIEAIGQQLSPMTGDTLSTEAVLIRLATFSNHALQAGLAMEVLCKNLPANMVETLGLNREKAAEALTTALEQIEASDF